MELRRSEIIRTTTETDIKIVLELDGEGRYNINTGCGFLNHMLELFARHGSFDLSVDCKGDTGVDDHHTAEDIGMALGMAFRKSLGEKRGIKRYGSILLPMDEALVLCSVDISGRTFLNFDVEMPTEKVGTFDTELVKEFMMAFARELGLTLHVKLVCGENSHHIIEAVYKGLARALKEAAAIDGNNRDRIPSTKGVL
ncbi:MAG: imidazoleglycerol-phosphate dehydratase HisB [Anaerovorax sp.]